MSEHAVPTEEEKLIGALVHASGPLGFGGWAPLVIWLIYKDKSPFVAYHAYQAMIFHLVVLIVVVPVAILTCGIGALLLLPWMGLEIWLALKAYEGEWISYPAMDSIGKRIEHQD